MQSRPWRCRTPRWPPSAGIVSLDDLSTILVGFEVPERWARRISSGLPIEAAAQALPGSIHRGEVTAIDSRVDETSRTLRMEAALGNERGDLKPGMSIAVGITFPGEERLGVPSLAVQWDREGSFVWKLDGDVVRRTEVAILSRRSDRVIVQGNLSAGDEVVVEGVQRLRDGAKVARVGDASPAPQAKPETAPMAETQPESAPVPEAQARTATAEPQPEAAAAPQAEAQTATPPEPQAAAVP